MHFNPKISLAVIASLALGGLTSCAPRLGGTDYSIRGAGETSTVLTGVIISTTPINISAKSNEQDSQLGAGALVGAGVGAVGGSLIGKGRTPWITGTVGAVAGGAAGHAIERGLTDQQGMLYEIQLDRGGVVAVSQGLSPALGVGQRVKVIQGRDRSRVLPE